MRSALLGADVLLALAVILAVEALPTSYSDPSEIPPAPTPLEPGFELLQGAAPFICRS